MAELDEPGNEPNFDLFGSFGLDFFSDDRLLLTETDLTEQTEIGQINDEDIDNFIAENRNRMEANCKITIFFAHCSYFSSLLRGSEKYHATRKTHARIICRTIE